MSRMKRSAAGRLSLAWLMPENSNARTRVLAAPFCRGPYLAAAC